MLFLCAHLMECITGPAIGSLPYMSRKEKPQNQSIYRQHPWRTERTAMQKSYWDIYFFPVFWSQLDKKCLEIRVSQPERMMEPKFPLPPLHVLPSLRSLWLHRYFNFASVISHCLTRAPPPDKPCLMASFWGQMTGIAGFKPPEDSKQDVVHLTPSSEDLPDDPYQSNHVRRPW